MLKTCAASELAIAVREVLRGKSYLSPTIAKDTVDFLLRQDKKLVEEQERLTERHGDGDTAASARRLQAALPAPSSAALGDPFLTRLKQTPPPPAAAGTSREKREF